MDETRQGKENYPPDSQAGQHIEHFFARLQMINRFLRAGTHWHARREITRVQWMILRHTWRKPGCTVGQLADRLDVRPSTMSQMLDRLEREQLIVRRADNGDSRVRNVYLTADGEQLINEVEAVWLDKLRRPFAQLTPSEQETLIALLDRLASGMDLPDHGATDDMTRPVGGAHDTP